MKFLILTLGVVICPSWDVRTCLDDLNWNACVDKCEDTMESCLKSNPKCIDPQTIESGGCDSCALNEADCVLACPNPPDDGKAPYGSI